MEPIDREICKFCNKRVDEHFIGIASNGAAIACSWGEDGTSVNECFPDSLAQSDYPKCICCGEPIIDNTTASHAKCTQTIIDERDYFQNINKKYAGSNTWFWVDTGNRSLYSYEVYQRTEHGDIRVGNMYRYDEAVTYCNRMNEARNR